jgi:hypothetical protein
VGNSSRPAGHGESTGGGRRTWIEWFEASLKVQAVVTPSEGGAATPKPSDDERIRKAFRMSEWDPKPVLLYFHFPHEEKAEVAKKPGRAALQQCAALDDEFIARWCALAHCVEVDMSKSDRKARERFGAGAMPAFALVDQDLNLIAGTPVLATKPFAAWIEATLPKFETYWKTVTERLEDQKKARDLGQSLEKKKDLRGAIEAYQQIRTSNLRIAPFWDETANRAAELEKQIHEGK